MRITERLMKCNVVRVRGIIKDSARYKSVVMKLGSTRNQEGIRKSKSSRIRIVYTFFTKLSSVSIPTKALASGRTT